MSCHAHTVESLSEALVPLRWTHEEGLSPRRSSRKRASVRRSRRMAQPRLLAATDQPHIRDREMGVRPITLASGP